MEYRFELPSYELSMINKIKDDFSLNSSNKKNMEKKKIYIIMSFLKLHEIMYHLKIKLNSYI